MMSISRNRLIGQVLKSRFPVKKTHMNFLCCVTENSQRGALSTSCSNPVLEAVKTKIAVPPQSLEFAANGQTGAKNLKFGEIVLSNSSLRSTGSDCDSDMERSYVLMHAFESLTITSVHLPTDSNTLNPAILPSKTEIIKNRQITVPSVRQYKIQDPSITRLPVANIEEPASPTNDIEKRAERLIVIRRRKMKKHKLRKLRKRMKFEFEKVRNRREKRKETAFQAELLTQMKQAEDFDAEKWAEDFLQRSKTCAKQRAEAQFWDSDEGRHLSYLIYLNTRKIPPDQR